MGTYFEDRLETSSGEKVKIRVPSAQGGTDRTIYKSGIDSGYYLGDSNDHVYRNGQYVADNLRDFVKMRFWLWGTKIFWGCNLHLFFIAKKLYFI